MEGDEAERGVEYVHLGSSEEVGEIVPSPVVTQDELDEHEVEPDTE